MQLPVYRSVLAGIAALAVAMGPTAAHAASVPSPTAATDSATPSADVVSLDLYNLTDVHGHIEQKTDDDGNIVEAGAASMKCYLDRARTTNPNSTFTLLGDNIGASTFTSGILHDNPTVDALSALNPAASTIGNHELDDGQDVFRARTKGATVNGVSYSKFGFPYLAANVSGSLDDVLGDHKIVTTAAGVRVAFIGGIAQDVPYKLSPGTTAGMKFADPAEVTNKQAQELKESGKADVVVAMIDDDAANTYPKMGKYVDALMGGDTHVPYKFENVKGSQGNTLVATASGSYMDNLSKVSVQFDTKTKKVLSSDVELIPAAKVAECGEDASVAQMVATAKKKADKEGEKPVAQGYKQGFARGVFAANDKENPVPGSNRGIESTLGDMVADSMKDTVLTKDGSKVDIGIINAGGLREDLRPRKDGSISYRQVFDVAPFGNELGYVTVSGADFKKALEQQWKTDLNSQNSRPLLKLGLSSNVRYTYDPSAKYGERITSVYVNDEPLDLKRKYTIGSVTFLLEGGDSFDALTAGKNLVNMGNLDRDQLAKYLGEKVREPRAQKSSVGVTVGAPNKQGDIPVDMRGLSFSEGPGVTKKVTVTIGDVERTADVNNSLVEPKANTTDSIITTDGAGQAQVSFKKEEVCGTRTGRQDFSVAVATDFGTSVSPDQLKTEIDCGAETQPRPTDDGDSRDDDKDGSDAGPSETPGDEPSDDQSSDAPAHAEKDSGDMPRTGANIVQSATVALILIGMGVVTVAWTRRTRK